MNGIENPGTEKQLPKKIMEGAVVVGLKHLRRKCDFGNYELVISGSLSLQM